MKIAGHTLGTPDHTVPEALKLFRRAGLDAAEVIYQNDYISGLPIGDAAAAAEAARVAEGEGIPIIGLTPYTTAINATDQRVRQVAVDELRSAIEIAHIVGATRVRVYSGAWQPDQQDHAAHWTQLVRSFQELSDPAAAAGVVLCAENHFGTMTQTAHDTAKLVRAVDSPAVRVLYDQANLTFTHDEGVDEAFRRPGRSHRPRARQRPHLQGPERALRRVGDRTCARRRTCRHLPCRRRRRPRLARALRRLREVGYDDVLSLEYEYRWHPQDLDDPEIGFRRGAQHLRTLLSQIEQNTPDQNAEARS